MNIQSLTGDWQFRRADSTEWLPAKVPGGVHTDLMALGKIPDPFVADNELKVLWVAETDWEYQRTFNADAKILSAENIALACDGLDTIADIYLNGIFLGHVENMFRRWEWDVKPLLRAGENELRIMFGSPIHFVTAKQAQLPLQGGGDIPGAPHLRKAPCHFGWDWGPKLPPIGIWKDIRLEGYSARFENVHVRQNLDGDIATISADLSAKVTGNAGITAVMMVTAPDGKQFKAEESLLTLMEGEPYFANLSIEIAQPQLWWPNGYGAQPLYQVDVALTDGKTILDQRHYQIGLRVITLRQEPDQWGKEFAFYINGVRLFAKGADWIPTDSLPTRITESMLAGLLKNAVDANMNMLRVWGGGYYPEDMFYNLCDRYGILVWQDFMFACGIYPADADFFENFRVEAIENIRRLRHHAALALWCGNNEMEQGWCDWGWTKPDDPVNQRLKDGYDRMFHHLLPELLEIEDPDHSYWPSSASANTPFEGANNQVQGDCHYWDVWHGRKPFTAYRAQFPRFMSEFGFQALPPLKTIATYADPVDWNMTSYIMEHHQKNNAGNSLMITQMTDAFRMPKDFDSLVYLSLVLQAEGIRYGVEHWRRNCNRVSGTLIWQLNDCWPVASWSSLDYFGRWKALHYAARRFYAPVMLSIEDKPRQQAISVTSDLLEPWTGTVNWSLESLDGQVLDSGQSYINAAAQANTPVCDLDFSTRINKENIRNLVFIAELRQSDQFVARQAAFFTPIKHLSLTDPAISVNLHSAGDQLVAELTSKSLAVLVELSLNNADVVFSDNYFPLPAGRTVKITCPMPAGWTLAQAQKEFRVRSVYDSY
jgi:beta-mannosidase